MPEETTGIRRKVDDFFTNYLRNTTTDQEILDFYGEGNIVGRKGIPAGDRALIEAVESSNYLNNLESRPVANRPVFSVGGIDQKIGYDYKTSDIPGVVDPASKRPWQMTFGELPKDFGAGSLTPAAKQYLADFRIPRNQGSDYSFATGPNIQDRIDYETKDLLENDPYYGRRPDLLADRLSEIKGQSDFIGDFGGQPQTPKTWQERGYIQQKPDNLKENVLAAFKDKIFETQGPFGGVSTLTPVQQNVASNPNWRADLYEKAGLAGPLSSQSFSSGYGGGSKDVQRFTTGKERLLPLQPYSEFFQNVSGGTPKSVIGTEPSPDFTPFQKAIGTRNYLIGRNILEGRGSLGAPVRMAQGAVPPKAVRSLVPKGFLLDAGINYALGMPAKESLIQAGQDIVNVSGIGQPQLAQVERRGDYFVDTRNNKILSSAVNPKQQFENMGVAQKNGQWVPVRRGTVAGEPSFSETVAAPFRAAGDVWKTRSNAAANQARYAWNALTKGKIPWWGR